MTSRPALAAAALAAAALVLAFVVSPAAEAAKSDTYRLKRNGKTYDVATVSRAESDYLALDDLARAFGAAVEQPTAGDDLRLRLGDVVVTVKVDAAVASVGGEEVDFGRAVRKIDGRTFVPPGFVTNVFAAAIALGEDDSSAGAAPEEVAVAAAVESSPDAVTASARTVEVIVESPRRESLGDKAAALRDAASVVVEEARAILDPVAEAEEVIRADVQVRSLRDYTRVLFRFEGTRVLPYTTHAPAGQIVLRVQADNIAPSATDIVVGDGAVESVSFARRSGRGMFTLELGPQYRDQQIAVLSSPFRVVIDVYRKQPYTGPPVRQAPSPEPTVVRRDERREPVEPPPPAATEAIAPAPDPAVLDEAAVGLPPTDLLTSGVAAVGLDRRVQTVVIDPGHGGAESGAKGPTNLLEKDVTLQLARRLKGVLERNLGVRVVLTRSNDTYLALDDRTGIANNEKADLFLSIHANGSERRNARGAETYFLSASHTDSEWRTHLAQETGAVPEASGSEGTELELILWSLAQDQFLRQSEGLAEIIQAEFNSMLGIRDRGVKQAPFRVLVGATMPAVLVEVGFITNPAEEQLLRDETYQNKIVSALYRSVLRFQASGRTRMGALAGDR